MKMMQMESEFSKKLLK